MHAEIFLKEFAPLASGPGGVQKLRELVLNLAIAGRLSDRLPEDGHASALVEMAGTAIREAVKSGEIRKPKYFEKMAIGELETPLPENWVRSKLGDLGLISPRNEAPAESVVGFVPMAAIEAKFGLPHSFEERRWADVKSGYTHLANGDVVLAKITPCFENGKSAAIVQLPSGIGAGTTELHVFRQLAHVVEPSYVLAFLKSESFIQAGIPKMTGTAGQKRIPAEYFALSPFPLPPLAEQKRIVAKVDALMALCDKLEARQAEETGLKRAAAASALHHLTEAKTLQETADRWSQLAPRFGMLFDDLGTIKALRGDVLDWAITGKLTDQLATDGMATDLLEQIALIREERQGQLRRKGRALRTSNNSGELHKLPLSWGWAILDDVCWQVTDGAHHTPKYTAKGIPFISVKDVSSGKLDFSDTKFISEETHQELSSRCNPELDDILLTKVGTTGIAVKVDTENEFSLFVSVALLKSFPDLIIPDYFTLALNSPFIRAQSEAGTQGVGNKNLVLNTIRNFSIPIAPVAEQKRIVAKVGELMVLCDRLEEQVREGERLNAELMASLVHALTETNPDGGPAQEAAGPSETTTAFGLPDTASDDKGEQSGFESANAARISEAERRVVSARASDVDTKFKEAVLAGAIVKAFFEAGGEPIGNFRLQKAVYFARRHNGEHVGQMEYLKKAAGPYNPSMKYSGGIAIAKQKSWLLEARGRFGFGHVPGPTASEMDDWIARYRYDESARWVAEHFRFKKNEEWETLATIDYAMEHLKSVGIEPDATHILQYIRSDDEWRPKIEKLGLTEISVEAATVEVRALFGEEEGAT